MYKEIDNQDNQIGYLHHVGLVVSDMEKALELYRRLGFLLQPPAYPMMSLKEGEPPKPLGVANTHVRFRRNFIELVTIAGDESRIPTDAKLVPIQVPPHALQRVLETIKRTVATLTVSLARFQGLQILVFQTPDAEATAQQMSADGVRHSGVNTVQREIDTGNGPRMVPVRLLEIDGEAVPEGRLAVAENPSLDVLRAQRGMDHPNGAQDLVEVILCVADTDLDDFERRYARYLARPVRHDGPARVFDLDGSRVTIIPDSSLEVILPGEKAPALPAFVAYAVAVPAPEASYKLLRENGFPVMTTSSGDGFVPAAAALGAAIIFRG
jgi:catechol 2,3-dioxygenase-like lactoylglutathione lyase family enzyme